MLIERNSTVKKYILGVSTQFIFIFHDRIIDLTHNQLQKEIFLW